MILLLVVFVIMLLRNWKEESVEDVPVVFKWTGMQSFGNTSVNLYKHGFSINESYFQNWHKNVRWPIRNFAQCIYIRALQASKIMTCHDFMKRVKIFWLWLSELCFFQMKRPTNEPRHDISNNVVCATSKGSDQPAHTRSLIRAFASRLTILWLLSYWTNIISSF